MHQIEEALDDEFEIATPHGVFLAHANADKTVPLRSGSPGQRAVLPRYFDAVADDVDLGLLDRVEAGPAYVAVTTGLDERRFLHNGRPHFLYAEFERDGAATLALQAVDAETGEEATGLGAVADALRRAVLATAFRPPSLDEIEAPMRRLRWTTARIISAMARRAEALAAFEAAHAREPDVDCTALPGYLLNTPWGAVLLRPLNDAVLVSAGDGWTPLLKASGGGMLGRARHFQLEGALEPAGDAGWRIVPHGLAPGAFRILDARTGSAIGIPEAEAISQHIIGKAVALLDDNPGVMREARRQGRARETLRARHGVERLSLALEELLDQRRGIEAGIATPHAPAP